MKKGYFQVYTGNGKGKTTSSLGVALRSIGAGYKVYIGQFMKNGDYSEIKALKSLGGDNLKIEQYGHGGELSNKDNEAYIHAAHEGLKKAYSALTSGEYDLVILDETNVAIHCGYLELDDVLSLIDKRPENTELIITGRYAKPEILEKADLVTEMKEIKHYYQQGVPARKGIEK